MTIVHMTSAHPRYDTRIFLKQCISLSKVQNYQVNLIVADGKGNENKSKISIYDVGKPKNRKVRILYTTKQVLKKAIELNGDIYHLHDPELIPIGLKLKKLGKKVIFDIHENIVEQIQSKQYLNNYLKKAISFIYARYEKKHLNKFDRLILAETSYREYYANITKKFSIILNMPDITPLTKFQVEQRVNNSIFYIGGISNERGLDVTIEAIKILKKTIPDIFMHYIGNTYDDTLQDINLEGIEENIKFYGHMPLYQGMELSKRAKVGLSILKPIKNYTRSYSTKIFEYMAVGLPVVTSNFKLYKDIIEKHECGLCVDPHDPQAIAQAIAYILNHPHKAKEMSFNGKKAVFEKYNWGQEEKKLLAAYKEIADA